MQDQHTRRSFGSLKIANGSSGAPKMATALSVSAAGTTDDASVDMGTTAADTIAFA